MSNIFKQPVAHLLQSVAERASRRTVERLGESGFADEVAYRAASETILHGLREGETPHERFRAISDGFWFWLLTEGRRRNAAIRDYLPGLPPAEEQLRFTGDQGDVTLREGFEAYRLFRDLYEKHRGPLRECQSLLDYGCGWGRIIRFFLKDVSASVLVGADPMADALSICRSTNRWCRFEPIPFKPPSSLPANSFELIYSFSVFSHLSEDRHRLVLDDLARLLQPGGLLMVTTRSPAFFDYCAGLRANPDHVAKNPGHASSALAFPDAEAARKNYDAGGYCFHSFEAQGDWDHWGEAVIPRGYVQREWIRQLEFVDFVDEPGRIGQVVIVMRKPSN